MLPQKGYNIAFEGEARLGVRGGVGGGAVPGDDTEGREQDAPPVLARAVAQDDLEGVVGAGGEAGAVIGPVGEVADARLRTKERASS